MDMIQERAYAKLNLTLGVLFKRRDNYHALDSLMQTIDLYDTVTIERDSQVVVASNWTALPYNNTLRRAALAYQAYTGRGANIHVTKRIPAEAGMGGGSADAAAVLRGMQSLYGALDTETLKDIALLVGADVPFCLSGGFQRAEGIGEILTPLRGGDFTFLIAKPEKGISTKQLFYMLKLPRPLPQTGRAIAAAANSDAGALGPLLYNALEDTAVELLPEIGQIKQKMLEEGALGAAMTGSGSTVFGLYETLADARRAFGALNGNTSFLRICKSV